MFGDEQYDLLEKAAEESKGGGGGSTVDLTITLNPTPTLTPTLTLTHDCQASRTSATCAHYIRMSYT